MRFCILIALLTISGCAGSPSEINSRSAEKLVEVDTRTLCGSYGSQNSPFSMGSPSKTLRSEIERRGVFTPQDWALIDAHLIKPGMSELALLASRGYPNSSSKTETESMKTRYWTMSRINTSEVEPRVILEGDKVVSVSQ